ncbi:glutathionylspermidine synthase family protein [Terricaulis sp.]|uniref:glutathionylspermidine synthase family protein n=1 Tax=Terricaulis sp. TaxID=2768686 RepID=UPI0037851723
MKRESVAPRPDWRERLAAIDFHLAVTPDGRNYWREDQCYVLSEAEVEMFHDAATQAQRMIEAAVARVFADGQVAALGVPPEILSLARASWKAEEPTLYGRMDFAWDGVNAPVLLEFNADTPTALYEAAVVQWRWLVDRDPDADQFNSIQEKLVARWPACAAGAKEVHFATLRDVEEELLTTEYIRECANAAGVVTRALDISDIGWDGKTFVDAEERPIEALFKLYPSEWLAAEEFGKHLRAGNPRLIEPPWRLAASSKALLAVLHDMFPGHPSIAPAFLERPRQIEDFVAKPIFGREGAGVRFGARAPETPAQFDEPLVYQKRIRAKRFSGMTPVFGVWIIGGEACGLGVREDEAEITGPRASFVPHRIE